MTVISNGLDLDEFRPDPELRKQVRKEWELDDGCSAIGLMARFHAAKDHATFLRAAARIRSRYPNSRFVLCGDDVTEDNRELATLLTSEGLSTSCRLLGRRSDVARILNGLDVAVSSSVIEAFPNAVGEAMSAGVPCVATDAGDSALIVGNCGIIVPRRDPKALSDAVMQVLTWSPQEREYMTRSARQRICENFSIEAAVRQYTELYLGLAMPNQEQSEPLESCLPTPTDYLN